MIHLLRGRLGLFFVAEAINSTGSWAMIIAIWGAATYRFDVGGSGVALIGLTWTLPSAVLAPVAGLAIDRFSPRNVLVVSEFVAAIVGLSMAFAGSFQILLALATVQGIALAFFTPALYAMPPRLVSENDLPAANALLRTASDVAIVAGPALGAVAIAAAGFGAAFIVNSVTFLVGAAAAMAVPIIRWAEPLEISSRWSEMLQGARIAARSSILRLVLAMNGILYLIYGAGIVIEPLYVRDVLGRSPEVFAALQSTFGAALVLVGAVVIRYADRLANLHVLALAVAGSGLAFGVYLGSQSVVVAFIGIAVWGAITAFHAAPAATLLQRHTPMAAHGRVFAIDRGGDAIIKVIALTATGYLVDQCGPRTVALVLAGFCTIAGLVGWAFASR